MLRHSGIKDRGSGESELKCRARVAAMIPRQMHIQSVLNRVININIIRRRGIDDYGTACDRRFPARMKDIA
jgi:hypothetical protein